MGWTFYNSNGEALIQNAESEATQAEMEAETAGVKFVPPDLVKHSPGVAKVWLKWEQTGAHGLLASYNVTSVTDGGGAGDTDHVWATDFSGDEYVTVMGCVADATVYRYGLAAGTATTHTKNDTSAADQNHNFLAAYGDQ